MESDRTALDVSLEALKAGDRNEWARLVEQVSPFIYRLALRTLGNEQDAEDVLQETFIKAIRSLPGFEGRSQLRTWLYRIAVNESLMILRKRRPEVNLDDEPEGDDGNDHPVRILDWKVLPEREVLNEEERHFLRGAIDRLPEKLRLVFELRDVEDLSIRETAEALGITETAVKTRLLRARLRLRDELSDYFGERLTERPAE